MNIFIKENTAEKLKVILKPSGCFLIVGGLILTIGGLSCIWSIGGRVELSVAEKVLNYKHSLSGVKVHKEFSLATEEITDITREVKKSFMSSTYKVTIHMADETFEADLPFADGDQKTAVIDQLKEAIAKPDGSGSFQLDESGFATAMFLGGVCVIGGVICFMSLQTVSLTMGRADHFIRIRRRRQLLPFGRKITIDLADYEGIVAEEKVVRSTGGQVTGSYQILIQQKGGDPKPVAHGPMFTKASAQELIIVVEEWIQKGTHLS